MNNLELMLESVTDSNIVTFENNFKTEMQQRLSVAITEAKTEVVATLLGVDIAEDVEFELNEDNKDPDLHDLLEEFADKDDSDDDDSEKDEKDEDSDDKDSDDD